MPFEASTCIDVRGTGILENSQSHAHLLQTSDSHTLPDMLGQPCLLSGPARPAPLLPTAAHLTAVGPPSSGPMLKDQPE